MVLLSSEEEVFSGSPSRESIGVLAVELVLDLSRGVRGREIKSSIVGAEERERGEEEEG